MSKLTTNFLEWACFGIIKVVAFFQIYIQVHFLMFLQTPFYVEFLTTLITFNVMNMQYAQTQPLAAGPRVNQATYVSDCKSGYHSCFCIRGKTPCLGPIRQPPFQ